MEFDPTYFARVLKSKRELLGWDQKELARQSGVSEGSIARYESSRNTPMFDSVCLLADAQQCSTDDFWRKPEPVRRGVA